MNEAQRQLLQTLHRTHKRAGTIAPTEPQERRSTRFSELDLAQQVRIAKSTADALGVTDPFLRTGAEVSGTRTRMDGRWVENFASYDYLSLNRSAMISSAVAEAVETWGVSATASRLVGGNYTYHLELEERLARFFGTESALAFVSGHGANQAVVRTLMGPGDLVVVDALAHNSIYEGIRASGAAHVSFPHNDHDWVAAELGRRRDQYRNVLIVLEGLYSMDGDIPDLTRFVEIKSRYGAWLMVDEAHSAGVLGATGRGICEETGVAPGDVDILMGTLSKAFCSCGGYIAGGAELIEILRYHAPGFVYSVGISAPNAAAATAAIDAICAEPGLVETLRARSRHFFDEAQRIGLDCGTSHGAAVAPVIVGDSILATRLSNALFDAGHCVYPIISPAVPNKSARLRFFLNAGHTPEALTAAIRETERQLRLLQCSQEVAE